MKHPPSLSSISSDQNLSIALTETIRDLNHDKDYTKEFDSFMGKVVVTFRCDGSIRYNFSDLDSKNKFDTSFQMASKINPITRIDKEVYAIFLQSCFYKFCHPKTPDDHYRFRTKDGAPPPRQEDTYAFQLAQQTPFLNLIFSPKGILDDNLKLDKNLVTDVYKRLNFIQYLFFDANLAQIFSNHFRDNLKDLDEDAKKDLLKSILNFKKGESTKPLFKFVKYLKNDSSELGIVINDFVKTQSQSDDRLEVLKEITNHRDENSSFLEFLLEKNQYKPIKRLVGIASEILTSKSSGVKHEIEEIFDLKRLFSSNKTLNLLNKEHCKNLLEIFDIIQDPLQKKQYFEEVFLANNEAFIKKILNENRDDILGVFTHKIKEIFGSKATEDFIEKSRFSGKLKQKISELPKQNEEVNLEGVKRRRRSSGWGVSPKSMGVDEKETRAEGFPIHSELSNPIPNRSSDLSRIPDYPFDGPMPSVKKPKIHINLKFRFPE